MSSSRNAKRKSYSSKKRRSRTHTIDQHMIHSHHNKQRTHHNHHHHSFSRKSYDHTNPDDDILNIDGDIDIRTRHQNNTHFTTKPTKKSSTTSSKKRRGLNINLSAAPIQSLSKNTTKARSKPTMNTRDLTQNINAKPYNFVAHKKSNTHSQRHHVSKHLNNRRSLKHKKKSSTSSSARYKKRISAPIILPTSTTGSLSSSVAGSVTANLDHPTVPNTPNTPYYSNISGGNKGKQRRKNKTRHKHKSETDHKVQSKSSKNKKEKRNKSNSKVSHKKVHRRKVRMDDNGYKHDVDDKVVREKDDFLNLSPNNTLTTNSNSSTNSQETIYQKQAKRNYSSNSKSMTHSTENDDSNSCSTIHSNDDIDESDEYLDDHEINQMIRSCRRISKSRPRAYSKTRRVSQKLFGLMESLSLDNDIEKKKKKNGGIGYESESKEDGKESITAQRSEIGGHNGYDQDLKFEVDELETGDIETEEEFIRGKESHDYHDTLRRYGYIEIKVIAKSLQGIVIEAEYIDKKRGGWDTVIIKITDKQLHFNKISNKHGKSLSVQEDIIKEKKLLMYLTANNPPSSLTKFLGFFEDKYNYYLVMENGGDDFFDWIVKCHKWIRDGKLSLKQWNLYIHDLMMQIIKFLKWLHTKMNVCHLDISLENMLIKNNKYKSDGNGGIRLSRKMQIKFCDFGLAEYFDSSSDRNANGSKNRFICSKYVGKTHYKAPKVYGKKETFDARKADIWSLGVSFFMMVIGAPPYKLPLASDDHFPLIQQNNVMAILKRWGRDHYINKYTESLLNQMLQIDEFKRISIYNIENHPYFTQHQKPIIMKRRSTQDILKMTKSLQRSHSNKSNKSNKSHKRRSSKRGNKPSNPIHSNIMATYHDNDALMESDQSPPKKPMNHNIFQNLVMSEDDGQLFRYRKRKLTST